MFPNNCTSSFHLQGSGKNERMVVILEKSFHLRGPKTDFNWGDVIQPELDPSSSMGQIIRVYIILCFYYQTLAKTQATSDFYRKRGSCVSCHPPTPFYKEYSEGPVINNWEGAYRMEK